MVTYDGPGSSDPSAVSAVLTFVEASFGALVMAPLFLLAILVSACGLWRIGARRLAVAEILLPFLTIAYGVNAVGHMPDYLFAAILIILIFIPLIGIPLYAAAHCWRAGFRRTSITVLALVILGLGAFALRAAIRNELFGDVGLALLLKSLA